MKHSNGTEQSATECIINALMMTQYVKVMAIVSVLIIHYAVSTCTTMYNLDVQFKFEIFSEFRVKQLMHM